MRSYTPDEIFAKRKELPEGMEYYLKMQLFVKDKSIDTDSNLYIIFLCSMDGKCSEFINLPFGRKAPGKEGYKYLKKVYKTLTRNWVVLDCMVESYNVTENQSIFFLVNTALTI